MKDECILKMSGITKVFAGVDALVDVQLEINRGEAHALIGENGAGKSTLMKILIGLYQPDRGTIVYKGSPVQFRSVSDALNNGISMIHQEIRLIQGMTVAENIWLGREKLFSSFGIINKSKRIEKTAELLERLGIHINPKALVSDLSVAEMQLIELARAVSYNSEIIIMDEPTSALTAREIKLLYDIVHALLAKNVAVIFISHKIDEIFEICSKVTVLRDGRYIDTLRVSETSQDEIIKMVAGRDLGHVVSKEKGNVLEQILEVQDLSSAGTFSDISFTVSKGEIVGFYGLMGAGRTEIMRAIFGMDEFDSGRVLIDGKEVRIRSPRDAIRLGVGMLTEDRLRLGVIYTLSVIANTTIASFGRICKFLWMFTKKNERETFTQNANALSVKYASPDELIGQLSGGNQQKVLIGRWLLTNPKILILDEPTRGIDVGAKAEIHNLIIKLAQNGMAVIVVSSELPEILSVSDRILVVRNGRIVHECLPDSNDQVEIVSHAFGIEVQ